MTSDLAARGIALARPAPDLLRATESDSWAIEIDTFGAFRMILIMCRYASPHTDTDFPRWTSLLPIYSAPHTLCTTRQRIALEIGSVVVFDSHKRHSVPWLRGDPLLAALSLSYEARPSVEAATADFLAAITAIEDSRRGSRP